MYHNKVVVISPSLDLRPPIYFFNENENAEVNPLCWLKLQITFLHHLTVDYLFYWTSMLILTLFIPFYYTDKIMSFVIKGHLKAVLRHVYQIDLSSMLKGFVLLKGSFSLVVFFFKCMLGGQTL